MKCLLFCVLFASSVLSVPADKWRHDKTERKAKECIKEANVDNLILDVPMDKMSKEGKCIMACVLKKTGVMNVDGTIDLKTAKYQLGIDYEFSHVSTRQLFISSLEECTKEVQPVPNDMCETAYNWVFCQEKKIRSNKKV